MQIKKMQKICICRKVTQQQQQSNSSTKRETSLLEEDLAYLTAEFCFLLVLESTALTHPYSISM